MTQAHGAQPLITKGTDALIRRRGRFLYFGEYPQNLKNDAVTINENISDERGYFLGSDGYFYARVKATPAKEGAAFSSGEKILAGATYYFRAEPVRWYILEEKKGEAFLVCDKILAVHAFAQKASGYAESDLRAFMNETLCEQMLAAPQRALLRATKVVGGTRSAGASHNYEDLIFPLSVSEASKSSYGLLWSRANTKAKRLRGTDYALACGLPVGFDEYYEKTPWWLRSSESNGRQKAFFVDGYRIERGNDLTADRLLGVLPALRIQLVPEMLVVEASESEEYPEQITKREKEKEALPETVEGPKKAADQKSRVISPVRRNPASQKSKRRTRKKIELKELFSIFHRKSVRITALIVAIVIAVGIIVTAGVGIYSAHYIYFGEYPQSLKADHVKIDMETRDDRGYYLGSDGSYYKESGNDFYKVEPIRWRILEKKDGKAFLMCDIVIEHSTFSETDDNDYANSRVRQFLNETFYNRAFDEREKEAILLTLVDNGPASIAPDSKAYYEDTEDKIFLLSYQEAMSVETDAFRRHQKLQLHTSDYSFRKNEIDEDTLYVEREGKWLKVYQDTYSWWLRSPSDYINHIELHSPNGNISREELRSVDTVNDEGGIYSQTTRELSFYSSFYAASRGVVPAMWITLE